VYPAGPAIAPPGQRPDAWQPAQPAQPPSAAEPAWLPDEQQPETPWWQWNQPPEQRQWQADGVRRDYFRTRKRRMVTVSDGVTLTGSRSILARPGDEKKRMPSPSSTGRTYTRISSTSPRRRH
jgi:hypothetical protein